MVFCLSPPLSLSLYLYLCHLPCHRSNPTSFENNEFDCPLSKMTQEIIYRSGRPTFLKETPLQQRFSNSIYRIIMITTSTISESQRISAIILGIQQAKFLSGTTIPQATNTIADRKHYSSSMSTVHQTQSLIRSTISQALHDIHPNNKQDTYLIGFSLQALCNKHDIR